MKLSILIIIGVLLISTSFVSVGNQIKEKMKFRGEITRESMKIFDNPNEYLWSLFQNNFWSASNRPCCGYKNRENFDNPYVKCESSTCNHFAYIGFETYNPWDCWIYKLIFNDYDNSTCVCYGSGGSMNFFSSGTWTNDHELFVVEYANGVLLEIDLESCGITEIGGGGVGLNGLTYDTTSDILYGCSSYELYEIDSSTGEQELIGSFNNGQTMIEIACDANGVIYGWDVKFSGDSCLYTIDKETGEATQVGGMGVTLLYAQDGDFCKECDILYLAAWIYAPVYGSYLCTVNKTTGELIVGDGFEGNHECSFFVIPDDNELPVAIFNWTPQIPQPGEEIIFNASESYDPDGYIKLYEWDWDNDRVFDEKNYTSPQATHNFELAGMYQVTLCVHDSDFATNKITKTIRVGNQPPSTPEIDGKKIFKVGEEGEYTYTSNSTDPEVDNVRYLIKWPDNMTEWIGPFESGEIVSINIIINASEKGIFEIFKVKAEDVYGEESDWGILEITVPKNQNLWLSKIMNRFPLLQKLLFMLII